MRHKVVVVLGKSHAFRRCLTFFLSATTHRKSELTVTGEVVFGFVGPNSSAMVYHIESLLTVI